MKLNNKTIIFILIFVIVIYMFIKLCRPNNDMKWDPLETTTVQTNEELALERVQNSRLVISISCRDVPEDRIRQNMQK